MIIKPNNWGKHKLKTKHDPDQWMTTRASSWYEWHMGPEHYTGVRAVSVTSLNLAYEVAILMPAGPLHLYVTLTTCLHQSRCVLTRSARRHKHTRPGTHWMRAGKSANINAHWMRVSRCAMIAHGYIATSCCKYRFIIDSLPSSLRIINYDTLRQCWSQLMVQLSDAEVPNPPFCLRHRSGYRNFTICHWIMSMVAGLKHHLWESDPSTQIEFGFHQEREWSL